MYPIRVNQKAYGSTIELPENIQSKCSMLYPVGLGLPFDHIVNVVIEITDTDTTLTAINAEKKRAKLFD